MAQAVGYMDDSRPNDRMWVVAGYVGSPFQWQGFGSKWPVVLCKHGVPYFHMGELGSRTGVSENGGRQTSFHNILEKFFRSSSCRALDRSALDR